MLHAEHTRRVRWERVSQGDQDRKLQCLTALRTYPRIAAGVHRFGKPCPDVGFAAGVGGLG